MSRVVSVSNRVALPDGSIPTGGLAVGLSSAMKGRGGLWFGWNGRTLPGSRLEDRSQILEREGISYATISLPESLQERCYNGYANGTLWPLFHYLLDSFRFDEEDYQAYRGVNRLFAQHLLPLLEPGDLIWVHDYHLFPLGGELRAAGVTAPLGFFLHIPFPGYEILRALPRMEALLRSLCQYDLIGFQTEVDRRSFIEAVVAVWGAEKVNDAGAIRREGRLVHTGVFPIGVDAPMIARTAARAIRSARVRRMSDGLLGRRLIIGIDRLDYSKGLLERFEGFRHFLDACPQHRGQVTYLQIASLGRQNVKAYARIRKALEQSSGQTNGHFADVDWTPIRYLNRNIAHETLMGFLRLARACLVTPLRDGMNLVAKEFIAAQPPSDPGVLVLSDRAGAAYELRDALIVNPYDTRGIARALQHALEMPLGERRRRHEKLLAALAENDIHGWYRRFSARLAASCSTSRTAVNREGLPDEAAVRHEARSSRGRAGES
jgi:trehalose 6-phosphate synthase